MLIFQASISKILSYIYSSLCIKMTLINMIAGIALLGANSDINEALSLSFRRDIVDIYSNSWGPSDSGTRVDGPGALTAQALEMGAREVFTCTIYLVGGFRETIFFRTITFLLTRALPQVYCYHEMYWPKIHFS